MTNNQKEKVKQYLMRCKKLDAEINALVLEEYRLRCLATKTCNGNLNGMPHSMNGKSEAGFCKVVEKLITINRLIEQKQDQYYDAKVSINAAINKLDNPVLRKVLRLRYLSRKDLTWAQIGAYINKSATMVRCNLHEKALKKITQYLVLPIDR